MRNGVSKELFILKDFDCLQKVKRCDCERPEINPPLPDQLFVFLFFLGGRICFFVCLFVCLFEI